MFWLKSKFIGLAKLWFFLGIFLLPFVFWPWLEIPYEIPKVWFFQRWVEGLGVLGFASWRMGGLGDKRDKKNQKDQKVEITILVLAFVLIAVFSSVLGVDLGKSVWGNYYRQDGLLTLFHLAGLFFFLNLFWEKSWREPTAKAIALGAVLVSWWTVALGLLGRLGMLGGLGRYGGSFFGEAVGATFGNPNFLAGYLLVTLPFTIWGMRDLGDLRVHPEGSPRGGLRGLGVAGAIGAILLTGSRAGILGVLVLGVLEATRWIRRTRGTRRTRMVRGIGGLVAGLILLGVVAGWQWRGEKGGGFVAESRERIWQKGISAFLKRPILGWGWANFDYAFESSNWPIKFNQDVYVDKAHSSLLEVLVCGGVVGFGVYGGMILLRLRGLLEENRGSAEEGRGNREWERTLLMVFLLYLFHSQTNVISINEEVIFWLILGVV